MLFSSLVLFQIRLPQPTIAFSVARNDRAFVNRPLIVGFAVFMKEDMFFGGVRVRVLKSQQFQTWLHDADVPPACKTCLRANG